MTRSFPSVMIPYAALLAGALAAAGCGPQETASSPRPKTGHACPQRAVLVVRNQTGGDADIMLQEGRSGTARLLASIRPGRHEIDIPTHGLYSYSARQAGATVSGTPFPTSDRITLEIECRNG